MKSYLSSPGPPRSCCLSQTCIACRTSGFIWCKHKSHLNFKINHRCRKSRQTCELQFRFIKHNNLAVFAFARRALEKSRKGFPWGIFTLYWFKKREMKKRVEDLPERHLDPGLVLLLFCWCCCSCKQMVHNGPKYHFVQVNAYSSFQTDLFYFLKPVVLMGDL